MTEFGTSVVDEAINAYLTQVYPAVAAIVGPPIEYLCIIYIAVLGYKALQGQFPVLDFVYRGFFVSLIFATLNWGGLGGQIFKIFDTFLTEFAKTIFASDADSLLEAFFHGVLKIGQALLDKAGRFGIGQSLQAIVLIILDIVLLAFSYSLLIFSKMGLAITMSIGPIFMGFFIFPATRQWAYNWISMMLNFTFLYILTMAILRFSFAAFSSTLNNMNDIFQATDATTLIKGYLENNADVYGLMLIMIIIFVFLTQVKSWAAALSSGTMVQTLGGMVASAAMTIARVMITKNPTALLKGKK